MDYSTATNAQLADECRARGLAAYGNKETLTARLESDDAARAPIPNESEKPVVQIAAGPDVGKDNDGGDELLRAMAEQAPPPPPAPAAPALPVDPRDQMLREMQAELANLRAMIQANAGASTPSSTGHGEPASPEAIARAAQTEQVFRTEFVMLDGVELGDGLHASLIAQTAAQAAAAGYRTRGGARRTGWGRNEHGQRTAIYEIYARK